MAATIDGANASPFLELANRNLHSHGWNIDRLEFLPQLRGRRGIEIYREMADNDALVGGILFAITMLLRQVEWGVEPAGTGTDGEPTPDDIERADFLASCKDDMSVPWSQVVSDALTMLPFGHAALELVYKRRETADIDATGDRRTRFPDGMIGWRKFTLIPQETISEFLLDEHGGVLGVVQGHRTQRVAIPIQKLVLFRTTTNNPRGKSALRNSVESWYFRKRIREVEGIGIDRDLAGLPVVYLDSAIMQNASRLAEYEQIVRNLRRDEQEGVILPKITDPESGTSVRVAELELLSTGGTRQFDTDRIVARYSREIAMALLQDVMLLGHEKVGTQALASEKRDLSDTALGAWLKDIADVINTHAVPRLFALNGVQAGELPRLVPGELRATDVSEFAEALHRVTGAGFAFSDDPEIDMEVRRRLGLPELRPEDRKRMEDERANPDPEPPMPAVPSAPDDADDDDE